MQTPTQKHEIKKNNKNRPIDCHCCKRPACWAIKSVIGLVILGALYGIYQQGRLNREELKSLVQELGQISMGSAKLGLQKIDYILTMARFDAQLPDAKNRLAQQLNEIARIASQLPKTYATPVQAALAQDQQGLAGYLPFDFNESWNRINAWISLVEPMSGHMKETVPATAARVTPKADAASNNNNSNSDVANTPNPTTPPGAKPETVAASSSLVDKLEKGWEQLKGIVTIHRGESDENIFVVDTQKWFIAEKLKMMLESLKLAMLTRDNLLFQRVRMEALNWLNNYYNLTGDDGKVMRDGLTQAAQWDVSIKPIVLQQTQTIVSRLLQQTQPLKEGKGAQP